MKEKILVTGGAGFIGSNFCNINREKFDCVALDNLFLGDPDNLHPGVRFVEGDACVAADLERCGTDFDYVIHFAGTSSAPMFMEDGFVDGYVNSIESFVRTLDFARRNGVKKFLYASTSSLYDDKVLPLVETQPVRTTNHYSVTKICYEHIAQCYNQVYPQMQIIGFRFMSVYGPNEESKGRYANLISQFIWDFARDLPPVIYGDGEQFRDFTNVADVVQGLTRVIEHDQDLGAQVFNIGTGETCSLNEMIALVKKYLKTDLEPTYIENPVKENYVMGQHANIDKICSVLGYKPKVSLEEGIAHQVEHLKREKIKETSSDLFR